MTKPEGTAKEIYGTSNACVVATTVLASSKYLYFAYRMEAGLCALIDIPNYAVQPTPRALKLTRLSTKSLSYVCKHGLMTYVFR